MSSTTSLTTARSLSDRLLDLDHSRRLSPGRLPRRAGHGPLSGVARVADSAYEFRTPIQGFCRFDSFYWGCCRRILRDRGEPVDTNPTLSANSRYFVFNNLAGRSGFSRAIAAMTPKNNWIFASRTDENRRVPATWVSSMATWVHAALSQRGRRRGDWIAPVPVLAIDRKSLPATRADVAHL